MDSMAFNKMKYVVLTVFAILNTATPKPLPLSDLLIPDLSSAPPFYLQLTPLSPPLTSPPSRPLPQTFLTPNGTLTSSSYSAATCYISPSSQFYIYPTITNAPFTIPVNTSIALMTNVAASLGGEGINTIWGIDSKTLRVSWSNDGWGDGTAQYARFVVKEGEGTLWAVLDGRVVGEGWEEVALWVNFGS